MTRRALFSILPAGCAGCLARAQDPAHSWTEKADITWEHVFRFAFQRNFIPYMKAVEAQVGRETLTRILKEAGAAQARRGMDRVQKRDFATWVGNMKSISPMFQHALTYEIVEDAPAAFEFRVSQCLWAKVFRESDAADIGYAAICHPDFAVASGFNPKLKLVRTKTLMQGQECCNHRYVMES
jgi:hypothetical protein